jgi:DNA-binding LytR/AlgR family response regulator
MRDAHFPLPNAASVIERPPTALIAEDEPLLRQSLERLLESAWPELMMVARARNGREAIDLFEQHRPDVCFLDVHMPGTTGIEAARLIGRRAHLVFVTAHDQYAIQAFEQGVLDYIVKPVDPTRLAETVLRLKERLRHAQPAFDIARMLQDLSARLERQSSMSLRWIRASVGQQISLIAVVDIDFLRSEEKYTTVAWHDEAGANREGLVRLSLKDLLAQLDGTQFVQVHRSVVVNMSSITRVVRNDNNETAEIHLKGRDERLPVSRNYLHVFRQM